MTIFKKLTIFKLINKIKPDFLCEKLICLPVAITNILTSEMLKMSLRAQSVMKGKGQKTIKMQYGNLELFAKSKEGKI